MLMLMLGRTHTNILRTARLPIAAAWLLSSACTELADDAPAAAPLYSHLALADGGVVSFPGPHDRTNCDASRPDASTVSDGGGSDFGPRRGMIVPAYMPVQGVRRELFDPPQDGPVEPLTPTKLEADWQRLIEAASAMSSAQKDFWVVVNGPADGPFPQDGPDVATQRSIAKIIWTKIRERGGRVFGYVHTGVRPTRIGEDHAIRYSEIDEVCDMW